MKIIYAIVSSDDGTRVTDVLTENHFSVTRLATTGGFLKKGNATLMIGTEAEKVDQAIGRMTLTMVCLLSGCVLEA